MTKDNNIILFLLAGGVLLYFLKNKASNFDQLKTNLGIQTNTPVVVKKFNGGKNFAQFYNNNRIVIVEDATKKRILAGSYSNGGKTILLDTGITLNNNSVLTNLETATNG